MFDRLQYKFVGKDIAGRFAAVMMPVSFLILLLTGGFISENIHFQSADTIVYNLGSGWYYGRWMARVRILWIDIEVPMLFFLLLGIGLIIMGIVGVILQYGEKAFYMYAQKYVPGIDPEPSTRLVFSYSAANAGKFFMVELIMWVKIILWSLLFIVPGIIKYYQYRLIPYLIASDPTLSYSEAQQRSVDLMEGEKMELFIMDLSFLGWNILDAFTAHILGAVWLRAYKESAYAAFFIDITRDGYPCPDNYFDFA
jgi:uncharacterized membrane protein